MSEDSVEDLMKYKVCLMGASFETGNRGVAALAASCVKNIIDKKPDCDISFLIGNRTSKFQQIKIGTQNVKIQVINYRLSPKSRIQEHLFYIVLLAFLYRIIPFISIRKNISISNPWIKALRDADFVGNIHGGDSFSDIYGIRRFIIYIIDDIIALLMGKKLVMLPQTYGPFNHFISKRIASYIMKHSYKLFSRDLQCIEFGDKMLDSNGFSPQIKYCPDVAFTLDSVKLNSYQIEPPLVKLPNTLIVGLNVNGLMYNGGYNKQNMFGLKCDYKLFLVELVLRFMKETTASLLLIPHTFGLAGNINSDPDACRDLLKRFEDQFKNRIHMVSREYDQSEIKGIIGLCDFIIGSRMHACIAGLSQEVPTVGVAYSQKFQGVFESVGAGDMVIDGRFLSADEAVSRVFKCFQNRAKISSDLKNSVVDAKSQVKKTFDEILS
jgi:colanic acid/amylovoran biosynthesis protein